MQSNKTPKSDFAETLKRLNAQYKQEQEDERPLSILEELVWAAIIFTLLIILFGSLLAAVD